MVLTVERLGLKESWLKQRQNWPENTASFLGCTDGPADQEFHQLLL